MDPVLKQIGQIPGVVGSMVYDPAGRIVSAVFPPLFEPGGLAQMAAELAADTNVAGWMAGRESRLDLRYRDGRVVVCPLQGAWLFVLCTSQVNPQLLNLSLSQAVRRLERLGTVAAGPPSSPPVPAPPPAAAPPAASPGGGALDRLEAIARAELGPHAAQALELLGRAGPSPSALADAVDEVERMVRLFVNKKSAEKVGQRMRAVLDEPLH